MVFPSKTPDLLYLADTLQQYKQLGCRPEEVRLMNFDHLQFEAQNARVTKTLQQQGASSSLFSLYLAMQIDDISLHSASLHDQFKDENAYASIYQEPIQNTEHLHSRLYCDDVDYKRQSKYFGAIASSSAPTIELHFLNAFMPQALHYRHNEIMIPEELIDNLPYASQLHYKNIESNEGVEEMTTSAEISPFDGFFEAVEEAQRYSQRV